MKRILLAMAVAVLTLASYGSSVTLAKTLKLQASSRAGDWAHRFMTDEWGPKLGEMTGRALEVEVLATSAVAPYRETIDAVANGILDGDLLDRHLDLPARGSLISCSSSASGRS